MRQLVKLTQPVPRVAEETSFDIRKPSTDEQPAGGK